MHMCDTFSQKDVSSSFMSIGAVSKLTGISVHTLRAWEKRYQIVSTERSINGRRLYHPDDVRHLKLLRELTEAGHPIGNIASLKKVELEKIQSLGKRGAGTKNNGERSLSLAVYQQSGEDACVERFRKNADINLVLHTKEIDTLKQLISERNNMMAVVLIFEGINKIDLLLLRRLLQLAPIHQYFIVYSSAHREYKQELTSMGYLLLRAPVSHDYLYGKVTERYQSEVKTKALSAVPAEVPEHKFTKKQLDYLATIPSAINCECPKHIAEIIRALTVFESYCQSCESKDKEEAFIHNDIYKLTAQARHKMETAVSMVVEAEKITLP